MGINKIDIDKVCLSAYVFFLPFTNVFVFSIGFPLKISEIILFAYICIKLMMFRTDNSIFKKDKALFLTLAIFTVVAITSTVINSFWYYDYKLNYYEDVRVGYVFDSYLKLGYLLLALISFALLRPKIVDSPQYFIRIFLKGGFLACLFCWYLFMASFLNYTPHFFNSSGEEPQTFYIPILGEFYRSGTFKEGNHMGLYLLVCVFFAHQLKSRLTLFYTVTIVTTFSTGAFIGVLAYFAVYYFLLFIKKKAYGKIIGFAAFATIFSIVVFSNEYVKAFTIYKLSDTDEMSDTGSKDDRLELVKTSTVMAFHNPVIGVGLSNFGMHYYRFTENRNGLTKKKRIANNVYLEIFSETGMFGFISFLLFLTIILIKIKDRNAKIGFIIFLIYLNVYPTFTLLFLWFYLAAVSVQPGAGYLSDQK